MDCSHSSKIFPDHKGRQWICSECPGKADGTSNCSVCHGSVTGGGGKEVEESSFSGSDSDSTKGAHLGILIFLQV